MAQIGSDTKLSTLGKSEFPSQTENRRQWILDTVRANQIAAAEILIDLNLGDGAYAVDIIQSMYGMDRDALLKPGGILTDEQIERLTQ